MAMRKPKPNSARLPLDYEHNALGSDEAVLTCCGPVAGHHKALP
jgi:hypothetical protein